MKSLYHLVNKIVTLFLNFII